MWTLLASTALALPPGAAWVGQPNQADSSYGISVAAAGDVDGDGYGDVIVGAHRYDAGQGDEGGAAVYHGGPAGLDAVPSWTMQSNQGGANAGTSVAGVGDVNGDGYDDVVVGISDWTNGDVFEGAARLYLGGPQGLAAQHAWSVEGNQGFVWYGRAVAGAGDVNGDGYDDVIVGAMLYTHTQTEEGRAYVYLGSAAGLSTQPAWIGDSGQAYAAYGFAVAGIGDTNGDGYDDVAVGAYDYDNGQSDEGRVFVYLGGPAGPSATASWTAEADQDNAEFGNAVAGAGDVDHDGYADLIVGSPNYADGQPGEGLAFVYLGSATGLRPTAAWTGQYDQRQSDYGYSVAGPGDLNGDGYDDVLVGAPLVEIGQTDEGAAMVHLGSATGPRATPATVLQSNQAGANFGISVAGAGDVDGDGRPDLVVGAHLYDAGQVDEGAAFLFLAP